MLSQQAVLNLSSWHVPFCHMQHLGIKEILPHSVEFLKSVQFNPPVKIVELLVVLVTHLAVPLRLAL